MRTLLHPLGYPVLFESDAAALLEIARESWAPRKRLFDAPPISVRMHMQDGPAPEAPPRYRVSPEGFSLVCDPITRGEFSIPARAACLHVSSAGLDNPELFRHQLLECLVLTALDTVYFVGLHAACVVPPRGKGILLCGVSGSGKSTLAYACARLGWTFVSDDSHLAPGADNLVTGNTDALRLREPARNLFPELAGAPSAIAPNGKTCIEIHLAQFRSISAAASARYCVFLSRRRGPAVLSPYPETCAVEYFMGYNTRYDGTSARAPLTEFVRGRTWLLEYESLEDAIRELERLPS